MSRFESLPGFPVIADVERLAKLAAHVCDSTLFDVTMGNQRDKKAAAARKLFAYVARRQTAMSLLELGKVVGYHEDSIRSWSDAYGGLLVNERSCLEASQRLTELGRLLRERENDNH